MMLNEAHAERRRQGLKVGPYVAELELAAPREALPDVRVERAARNDRHAWTIEYGIPVPQRGIRRIDRSELVVDALGHGLCRRVSLDDPEMPSRIRRVSHDDESLRFDGHGASDARER